MTDKRAEPGEAAAARIARIIETIPGWTPPDQLLALHMLVVATSHLEGDIVEIGSWCGRSTAVLGHAAKASGHGIVHAIDLFPSSADWQTNEDGSHSFEVNIGERTIGGYQDQTVWDEPFQKDIATIYRENESVLDVFNASISGEGLTDVVTPFRGTGAMFCADRDPLPSARVAFVDGDHSYNATCADIDSVEQMLVPGGWIAFDDAFTVYEGVNKAITDRILGSNSYTQAHQVTRKLFVARRR